MSAEDSSSTEREIHLAQTVSNRCKEEVIYLLYACWHGADAYHFYFQIANLENQIDNLIQQKAETDNKITWLDLEMQSCGTDLASI